MRRSFRITFEIEPPVEDMVPAKPPAFVPAICELDIEMSTIESPVEDMVPAKPPAFVPAIYELDIEMSTIY